MAIPLNVLILDDNQSDAELIGHELKRSGFAPNWRQATSKDEYLEALETSYDIIIADYTLPNFDALVALRHLKERHLNTPFIVITGSLGDEAAAECIKQGATDYLLKDRLKRLGPAIIRALEERRKIDQQKIIEEQLRLSQELAAESLRQANATLEQRVTERTIELTTINEQLRHETAERIRAEEALVRAQKMEAIGKLTGSIAHDFNNLLQIIIGNLDILSRQPEIINNKKQMHFIEAAITGAKRGEHLVKGLLAFGGRQPLNPQTFDVNNLVIQSANLFRQTLGETIIVDTSLTPNPCWAIADPHQLEAAILNLALNARDAMPNGGKLTITTNNTTDNRLHKPGNEDNGYIQITIADTGCGISPDILSKVVEPFFTTKKIGQVLGLGLSQVYGYVNQSNGYLDIRSGLQKGTSVEILLPRSLEYPATIK
jgi:signal transduction histidine kinase